MDECATALGFYSDALDDDDGSAIKDVPALLRQQRNFTFAPEEYDFRSIVGAIIAPDLPVALLHKLHEHEQKLHKPSSKSVYETIRHRWWETNTAHKLKLRKLIHRFVINVIAPLLWEADDSMQSRDIIYQVHTGSSFISLRLQIFFPAQNSAPCPSARAIRMSQAA